MELIRFKCPACTAALTVPPAAAGFQGPCPKCSIEIVGPDPALGLPASLPVEAPAPAEAFEPFPDSPAPAAPPEAPPVADEAELAPPTDPFAGSPAPAEPPATSGPEPESEAATEDHSPDAATEIPELLVADDLSKEVTPPESVPEETPDPIPAARPASASTAVLVLSGLLCVVLAFVGGFAAGRRFPEPAGPIFSLNTKELPATTPEPIPVPVRTWIPDDSSDDSGEQRIAGPEATLRAFLNAEGWAARSRYVMFPESIRQAMEARAKTGDDGPIQTTDVSLFEITKQAHIFKVATSNVPEGFPVAVARDHNNWQVDWQTFIEFHDDRFSRFSAGKEGDHGVYHLLVKPVKSDGSDALFERFLLNPPIPGRERSAYLKKGSVTLARLQGIFDRSAGFPEKVFTQLLENNGPPMVLALSYKVNSEGQAYLQIDDVVAIGWGPGEPQE